MRYEAEADTAQTSAGDRVKSVGLKGNGNAVFFGALSQDSVIVGGAAFIFGRVDCLIHDVFTSSGGNEKEDMMGDSAKFDSQFLYFRNLIQIGFGDGGVDLKFHADFFQQINAPQRTFKSPFHLAKTVVGFSA